MDGPRRVYSNEKESTVNISSGLTQHTQTTAPACGLPSAAGRSHTRHPHSHLWEPHPRQVHSHWCYLQILVHLDRHYPERTGPQAAAAPERREHAWVAAGLGPRIGRGDDEEMTFGNTEEGEDEGDGYEGGTRTCQMKRLTKLSSLLVR